MPALAIPKPFVSAPNLSGVVHYAHALDDVIWREQPDYHELQNTFLIRVYPDAFTAKLCAALQDFVTEYDEVLKRLGLTENRATADAWRLEQRKAEAA